MPTYRRGDQVFYEEETYLVWEALAFDTPLHPGWERGKYYLLRQADWPLDLFILVPESRVGMIPDDAT